MFFTLIYIYVFSYYINNILTSYLLDQSKSENVCMGFIRTVKNMSAESQIKVIEVKYFAFDVQYNYELKPSSCEFRGNLQHVEMMLICRGKTGTGLFYIYA